MLLSAREIFAPGLRFILFYQWEVWSAEGRRGRDPTQPGRAEKDTHGYAARSKTTTHSGRFGAEIEAEAEGR